jgi:hypothetical protein
MFIYIQKIIWRIPALSPTQAEDQEDQENLATAVNYI